MKCPACRDADLVIAERQGVEIDYCPRCRGVWLDRGELDKILERASAIEDRPRAGQIPPPAPSRDRYRDDDDDDRRHYDHDRDYKRKKRGGFLGEIFDWD